MISLSLDDVELKDVLKEISKKTGLKYTFNCNRISKKQRLFVHVNNASVDEVLNSCLSSTELKYEIQNNKITIYLADGIEQKKEKGQLYQVIRGSVIDEQSQKPLAGASVLVLNSEPAKGTITDESGFYRLKDIPIGRHSLKISFVGYNSIVAQDIMLGSAKETVIDFKLSELVKKIDEVVVKAEKTEPLNDMAIVSARSFSVEETKQYPASISDPARMVLNFAGISTTSDYLNEIIVRGNSPQSLLWRIEGIEVPSPNHFSESGLTGGAISILSSNVLARSDFFTGAFPAEYGNALSGVFDIALRNGNNEKTEFAFQAGILGLDIAAEGPFKKNYGGSYLFNYRFSSLFPLNELGIDFGERISSSYQDLSFNLNFPTKKIGNFSIWGVGGYSFDAIEAIPDSSTWDLGANAYDIEWDEHMVATGISHVFYSPKSSFFKTTIALTKIGSSYFLDTLNNNYDYIDILNEEIYETSYKISFKYGKKVDSKFNYMLGANFSYTMIDYKVLIFNNSTIWRSLYNVRDETLLYYGYWQFKYKITNALNFNGGVNYLYFQLNKNHSIEPRMGIKWYFRDKQSFAFAYGLHSKHDLLLTYYKEFLQADSSYLKLNKQLDLPKAHHFVLSYSNRIGNKLNLKIETYYQYLFNYYISADPNYTLSGNQLYYNFDIPFSSSGLAKNYGIELTLEKNFSNSYYFLITSSIFKSKYQAGDKKWYNSTYDLGYVSNIIVGKEFKFWKNNLLSVNLKANLTGGKRDTPIDKEQSLIEGYTVYEEKRRNELQYPGYFRIDLGMSYRINRLKTAHVFSLDIQNLTNRANIAYQYFDVKRKDLIFQHQAGLIPIFNYRLEF